MELSASSVNYTDISSGKKSRIGGMFHSPSCSNLMFVLEDEEKKFMVHIMVVTHGPLAQAMKESSAIHG